MASELAPPPPGSMTVPPLFGWEAIAAIVVLVVVLGVAFLLVATTRSGAGERSEWRAWLDARSGGRHEPIRAPDDRTEPGRARADEGRFRAGGPRTG